MKGYVIKLRYSTTESAEYSQRTQKTLRTLRFFVNFAFQQSLTIQHCFKAWKQRTNLNYRKFLYCFISLQYFCCDLSL